SRENVLGEIETSDLRGLGGAGFPVSRKWRFLLANSRPKIIAVNADEGEPGTFKDRHCLETNPHKVLEGALIAAWVIEAEAIYIYLRDEYPHIRAILEEEIAKIEQAGLSEGVKIHLRRGAGAYVCGEETALLESLEGNRGLPRNRPPFPANEGLFGLPTLINNVESLYFVAEIVTRGAEWYSQAGRPHFYSVSGHVREPGVKLAPAGISVNELIEKHAGGMTDGHTFTGYLPGGASGGILPASKGGLAMDFGTLEEYGCFVGSSAVVILSDKDDIRDVVKNLTAFFEEESCGQCTPCRAGCEKLSLMLESGDWDDDLIRELSDAMREASICGLGQAASNPVISALNFFRGEVS
ncbi:MAG: NADH-ubiquinone oxidoreductase-F iron-sulfur binding region domain-containing protein, partial [Rhodospirillales bacterium]|nr:NADH-ubiquinone oxidoreductase-F iron-sulfur binding region domain-containing protein [Rhodospirillales bacterium]